MMRYPKVFEVCPACGSNDKVIATETDEEISNKHLSVGTKMAVLITRTPIFNPKDAKILSKREIPVILAFYDICYDCGTLYCCEVQKTIVTAQPQLHGRNNGDKFPFVS